MGTRCFDHAGIPYPEQARSITVSRTDLLDQAVVQGLGIALGDSVTSELRLRDRALQRVPGPTLESRSFYLLHREGRLRERGRRLVDWLLAQARTPLSS